MGEERGRKRKSIEGNGGLRMAQANRKGLKRQQNGQTRAIGKTRERSTEARESAWRPI